VDSWVNSPLAKNGNLLVFRYEDLRKDTETGLVEMLNFLGIQRDRDQIRGFLAMRMVAHRPTMAWSKAISPGATTLRHWATV